MFGISNMTTILLVVILMLILLVFGIGVINKGSESSQEGFETGEELTGTEILIIENDITNIQTSGQVIIIINSKMDLKYSTNRKIEIIPLIETRLDFTNPQTGQTAQINKLYSGAVTKPTRSDDGIIIYDPSEISENEEFIETEFFIGIPANELSEQITISFWRNTICVRTYKEGLNSIKNLIEKCPTSYLGIHFSVIGDASGSGGVGTSAGGIYRILYVARGNEITPPNIREFYLSNDENPYRTDEIEFIYLPEEYEQKHCSVFSRSTSFDLPARRSYDSYSTWYIAPGGKVTIDGSLSQGLLDYLIGWTCDKTNYVDGKELPPDENYLCIFSAPIKNPDIGNSVGTIPYSDNTNQIGDFNPKTELLEKNCQNCDGSSLGHFYYWKPKHELICNDEGIWEICDGNKEISINGISYKCENNLWID